MGKTKRHPMQVAVAYYGTQKAAADHLGLGAATVSRLMRLPISKFPRRYSVLIGAVLAARRNPGRRRA